MESSQSQRKNNAPILVLPLQATAYLRARYQRHHSSWNRDYESADHSSAYFRRAPPSHARGFRAAAAIHPDFEALLSHQPQSQRQQQNAMFAPYQIPSASYSGIRL